MTERNGGPAGHITCMPKVWGHWRFSNNQRQENGSNLMAWPKLFRQRIREVWGKSVEHCFTEMCRILPTIQRPEQVRKSSGMWHKLIRLGKIHVECMQQWIWQGMHRNLQNVSGGQMDRQLDDRRTKPLLCPRDATLLVCHNQHAMQQIFSMVLIYTVVFWDKWLTTDLFGRLYCKSGSFTVN